MRRRSLFVAVLLMIVPLGGCDWGEETQKYIKQACDAIAAWHAQSLANCNLLINDPPNYALCILALNENYAKLTGAKTAAILAQKNCDEEAFKSALKALEALLSGATRLLGVNIMPRVPSDGLALVQASAQKVGNQYQLLGGAFAQVMSSTGNYAVQMSGTFSVELVPQGTGFSGPVTALQFALSSAMPGVSSILSLDNGVETFPSTIHLQPDFKKGGFSGVMHVVVNMTNELVGDPTVVITFPVHTFNPFAQLNLTTHGQPVAGTALFPTVASTADPLADCNGNGIPDGVEIATGAAADCNINGIPDECDIELGYATDCDGDGVPDACQIAHGLACDTNGNGILEPHCESVDCNGDGIEDCEQMEFLDTDFNGVIDACEEASACASATIAASDPPGGVVDARQPFGLTGAPLQGIDSVTVVTAGSATPEASCWHLCETDNGGYEANGIASVTQTGEGTYVVTFVRPITPDAVTTLNYLGDPTGTPIVLISHPANVNADSTAGVADVLALIDALNNATVPPFGVYSTDIDRSGLFGAPDILRQIDLLNGAAMYTVQNLTTLPDLGDCPGDLPPPPSPNSCTGACGGQASGGCYCDEFCFVFSDCCADVCEACTQYPQCGE